VGKLGQVAEIGITQVYAVVFFPDGSKLVTQSESGAKRNHFVSVWDMDSGQVLYTMEGWGTVSFSPDGSMLAFTGKDGFVLLDANTGEAIHSLTVNSYLATYSPDWSLLVRDIYEPITEKSTLIITDTASDQELRSIGLDGMMMSVTFSPDGNTIALGETVSMTSSFTTVWDVDSGKLLATLYETEKLAFSPDGRFAAARYRTGELIQVYDISNWEERFTLVVGGGHSPPLFSPDGSLLATTYSDDLLFWDTGNGEKLFTLIDQFISYAFSPDGRLLATSNFQGIVRLWSILP
jgi:WD40 repeat protein